MGRSGDRYVSGGVNWAAFTLEELVGMVGDKTSVAQLERLADDWRQTGDGVVAAADYLADALDDLMNFWSGETADQARETVALNAQWVGDLGESAKSMADPIEETAGALKSAQETMPKLPDVPPAEQPGSAPIGADEASRLTGGSQLGAAVGATAAGSESALQTQAEQEEMKRVAVETMQRFEAAAVGIDKATPPLPEQSTKLRTRIDDPDPKPIDDPPPVQKDLPAGVDARWQALTGMADAGTTTQRSGAFGGGGGFSSGGGGADIGGGVGVTPGPVAGRGTLSDVVERPTGRTGMPAVASAAPASTTTPGMTGPIGGAPMGGMGMGGQSGEQSHRRRVPYADDDPFDTGEKASKPVIGL